MALHDSFVTFPPTYREIRTIQEAIYRERRRSTDVERQRLDDLIAYSFPRFNSLVGDTLVESLLELDVHSSSE